MKLESKVKKFLKNYEKNSKKFDEKDDEEIIKINNQKEKKNCEKSSKHYSEKTFSQNNFINKYYNLTKIFDKNSFSKKSKIENNVLKKANIRKKEFEEYKKKSLINSIIFSFFILLFSWLFTKNIILSFGIILFCFATIFLLAINIPIIKHKKYTKKVEVDLSFFLTNLITELKIGKDLVSAIKKCSAEKNRAAKEYSIVINFIENGLSLKEALVEMNKKFDSLNIKRTNSNLYNIYQHGNDVYGLKKFADELLLRQRIESKEFGGKLVVYALVFIAISAIVPAMFASFILIGSYFMQIKFTAIQIFLILVILFPALDLMVLLTINSKTPLFLRS
jgi:pilus assembly protein TadC